MAKAMPAVEEKDPGCRCAEGFILVYEERRGGKPTGVRRAPAAHDCEYIRVRNGALARAAQQADASGALRGSLLWQQAYDRAIRAIIRERLPR